MFTKIALTNFKPFGGRVDVPLAPITLIYGPNSGGKSSVIQGLMLLKQTFGVEHYETEPGSLVPRGPFVDLGSFRSLVHLHELDREMSIDVEFTQPAPGRRMMGGRLPGRLLRNVEVTYSAPPKGKRGRKLWSIFSGVAYGVADVQSSERHRVRLRREDPQKNKDSEALSGPVFRFSSAEDRDAIKGLARIVHGSFRRGATEKTSANQLEAWLEEALPEAWFQLRHPLPMLRFGKERREWSETRSHLHFMMRLFTGLAGEFLESLEQASYLGPLRSYPARQYLATGSGHRSVGKKGEHTPQVLTEQIKHREKRVNNWFRRLEIPYQLRIKEVGDEVVGRAITLLLKDQRSKVTVAPPDVGFGVGQLLPILVEGIARRGSCICVEQPEIHLHPRLQAALADFFIETAFSDHVRVRDRNQWLVETHSEALVLRLKRRIRDGVLKPNDVSIIYVEPGAAGGRVHRLRLDSQGEFLDEWPDGFFEEDFEEIFGESNS